MNLIVIKLGGIGIMKFKDALDYMRNSGGKVKLPSWGGYWEWDFDSETIMMHLKNGTTIMDIRESQDVLYTLSNILSEDWIVASIENCPVLGGEATFDFGVAYSYVKRGYRVTRKVWQDAKFIFYDRRKILLKVLQGPDFSGINAELLEFQPNKEELLAEDWTFYNK
jgi:hypothetical protein